MKILIISPTSSGIGGIAQHVTGLINFLRDNGHTVEIMSSENTFTIPIKGLKNPSFMISSLLKSKFKKGFDIVHAHNIPAAYAMKNISGKKILSLHGIFSQQIVELHGKTIGIISEKFEHDALKWPDVITVISKEAYEHYSKLGFDVKQIPNAIDLESLPKATDRRHEKQVIFAGRLSKEKGIDTLVEIGKLLSDDIHLIILGDGPEKNKVSALAKSKTNIHYLGYQPKEKTIPLIRGSDALIQPSIVEGISSTILEAMACKTPIIATEVGGNKELLENNKTGILVEPDSCEKFLDKIQELFADKKRAKKIGENAFSKVQQYDWSNVGKEYLKIYSSLE